MVRPGSVEDLPAIHALGYLAISESETYKDCTPEFQLLNDRLLTDYSYGTFVSESRNGSLDGFLIGQLQRGLFFKENIGVNTIIYVLPAKRGTMVPYRLLQMFEKWCWDNGMDKVQLTTSGGINIHRNIRFFEGTGYKLSGVCVTKENPNGRRRQFKGTQADSTGTGAATAANRANDRSAPIDEGPGGDPGRAA